jgi:protein SCO1/2
MHRLIRITALTGIALLAILWVATWVVRGNPQAFAGTALQSLAMMVEPGAGRTTPTTPAAHIGGGFELIDTHGQAITDQQFRGKWMLVYFGYTYCPDVCPTELQTISAAIAKLGPLSDQIVPVFITIDPERDTPDAMASYVKLFDPKLVGLTGTPQQIAKAARAYRVYYAKVERSGDTAYLMDHSSLIYLMDPQGQFVALFNPRADVDEIATGLRNHLSQRG